jgi:hypothetical protein
MFDVEREADALRDRVFYNRVGWTGCKTVMIAYLTRAIEAERERILPELTERNGTRRWLG